MKRTKSRYSDIYKHVSLTLRIVQAHIIVDEALLLTDVSLHFDDDYVILKRSNTFYPGRQLIRLDVYMQMHVVVIVQQDTLIYQYIKNNVYLFCVLPTNILLSVLIKFLFHTSMNKYVYSPLSFLHPRRLVHITLLYKHSHKDSIIQEKSCR